MRKENKNTRNQNTADECIYGGSNLTSLKLKEPIEECFKLQRLRFTAILKSIFTMLLFNSTAI